mmetsp:Transcript_29929/g.75307  ORF Transcript_29929/g.75307 Transcript_29929/m.75307 type:complete len:206 (-) Transcript_29929:354-971(-)
MRVNGAPLGQQAHIHVLNELRSFFVAVAALVVRVHHLGRDALNLFLQQVRLVEEENDGHGGQHGQRHHVVEEFDRLFHAVDVEVLHKGQVVVVQRGAVQQAFDILKAVQPLASLVPLPSNIQNLEQNIVDVQVVFDDARCADTGTQAVILRGHKVLLCQALHFTEKIGGAVGQDVDLVALRVHVLHSGVLPQCRDGVRNRRRQGR